MTEQNNGDITQQLEQMETMLENCAKVMATYYKELIKQGVSEGFAEKLVLDYSHSLWSALRPKGTADHE